MRPTIQPGLEPLSLWRQHWRAVMLLLLQEHHWQAGILQGQAGMPLAAVWPVRFRPTRLLQRRPVLQARRLLQRKLLLRLRRLLQRMCPEPVPLSK